MRYFIIGSLALLVWIIAAGADELTDDQLRLREVLADMADTFAKDFAECAGFYEAQAALFKDDHQHTANLLGSLSRGAKVAAVFLVMHKNKSRDKALKWTDTIAGAEALYWKAMLLDMPFEEGSKEQQAILEKTQTKTTLCEANWPTQEWIINEVHRYNAGME